MEKRGKLRLLERFKRVFEIKERRNVIGRQKRHWSDDRRMCRISS
jgi:hypothetical protein